MIRKLLVIIFISILVGCSIQPHMEFKPIDGVGFGLDLSEFTSIELLDAEIMMYNRRGLIGSIKRVQVPEKNITAIEALKDGYLEASKGSKKPIIVDININTYCFVVHTDNFSSIFVATRRSNDHWVVISIRKENYNSVITSLKS